MGIWGACEGGLVRIWSDVGQELRRSRDGQMGGRRGGERRGWVDWGRRWRDRAGEKGERRKQLGGAGRRRKEQEIGWRGRKVGEMIRKGRDQEMGR